MKLSGLTEKDMRKAKQKGMGKLYTIMIISTLIMIYVLAHFVDYLEATTTIQGMQTAFWIWLGFIATISLGTVLWEGKPWKLYFLNGIYQLVSLAIAGAILAVW